MNPSTEQFTWTDRDTAARQMLQLVYYAPPSVSSRAISLLRSFRSVAVIPQLKAITLDEQQPHWTRIDALRAISAAPGNSLFEDFQPLLASIFTAAEQTSKRLNSAFLNGLTRLADDHPVNRRWFFEILDAASPPVQFDFVTGALSYRYSDDFHQVLLVRLVELLQASPAYFNLQLISRLTSTDDDFVWQWLNNHFERILARCLVNPEDGSVLRIASQWERLRRAIEARIEGWHPFVYQPLRRYRANQRPDYLSSPAYRYLKNLYDRASNGDRSAFGKLISIARMWRGNVPVRAVATYWIGKLSPQYDTFPHLTYQIRYGHVDTDWDITKFFSAPIRYEAGKALMRFKNAAAWEVLVDSYFISPDNDLSLFQRDWITYLTDVLSGNDKAYAGTRLKDGYGIWFRKLRDISESELQTILP